MNSGLVLTPPKQAEGGGEDGFLQAWENFEELRFDADLVVLSSCDSGIGRDLGGEGLTSLTRAFQFAGARSVVATLWQVVDRGAADLIVAFYRHLQKGSSPVDALRQAQLEIIARESVDPDPVRTWIGVPKTVKRSILPVRARISKAMRRRPGD